MIISDQRSTPTMLYCHLEPGTVFEFEDEFFIKLDNGHCACLYTGEYLDEEQNFSDGCEVTPVHAELVISDQH